MRLLFVLLLGRLMLVCWNRLVLFKCRLVINIVLCVG